MIQRNLPAGRSRLAAIAAAVGIGLFTLPSFAAIPGLLDMSFDGDGKDTVHFDLGSFDIDRAEDAAVQGDGKIVVVGWSTTSTSGTDGVLARILPDGGLDNSFDLDGKRDISLDYGGGNNDFFEAVAIQSSGKIVVAGTADQADGDTDMILYRFHANGSLDTDFATAGGTEIAFDLGGSKNDSAAAMTLDANGKIVVAGTAETATGSRFAVARFTADGTPDVSFDVDGKMTLEAPGASLTLRDVAVRPDGTIVLVGTHSFTTNGCFVAVLLSNGTPDPAFASIGSTTLNFDLGGANNETCVTGIPLADGRILVGGSATTESDQDRDFLLLRLEADGDLDNTFSGDGYTTLPFDLGTADNTDDVFAGMALQADGAILVAGTVDAGTAERVWGLARMTAAGTLDTSSFALGGKTIASFDFQTVDDDSVVTIVQQSDGKPVLVGDTAVNDANQDIDFGLMRFTTDQNLFVDGFESGDTSAWSP